MAMLGVDVSGHQTLAETQAAIADKAGWQMLRMNLAARLTAGTECLKTSLAPVIQQRFGHDAPRRIARAKEQNIEAAFCHIDSLSW